MNREVIQDPDIPPKPQDQSQIVEKSLRIDQTLFGASISCSFLGSVIFYFVYNPTEPV